MDGAKNYAKENQMTETWDASLGQNVATVETFRCQIHDLDGG